jgi:hypothetical protein
VVTLTANPSLDRTLTVPARLERGGVVRLADPGRAGARDFLAGARGSFTLRTEQDGAVALHTLRRR